MSVFEIFDIAKEVYPKLPQDDPWFPGHLNMKIEIAFQKAETIFAQERFSNYIGEAAAFNQVLFQIVVWIYRDKLVSMSKNECENRERFFGITAYCESLTAGESAEV